MIKKTSLSNLLTLFWVYLLFIVYWLPDKHFFHVSNNVCLLSDILHSFDHWFIDPTNMYAHNSHIIIFLLFLSTDKIARLVFKVPSLSYFYSYIVFQSILTWNLVFILALFLFELFVWVNQINVHWIWNFYSGFYCKLFIGRIQTGHTGLLTPEVHWR